MRTRLDDALATKNKVHISV